MSDHEDPPHSLDLYWVVPGILAGMSMPHISPRRHESPGALDAYSDELPALWRAGIRAVVCMLHMPDVVAVYTAAGFACHFMPVRDGDAPTHEQFAAFLEFLSAQRALGHPVAVHCAAGVGRTGTVLVGYLITAGDTFRDALLHVRSVRHGAVETLLQMRFLQELEANARV
jgi:protein-tyrosine phosphatase